jgi:hypothetical protein
VAFPVYIKAAGSKKISVAKEIKEVNRLRLRFELGMARKLNTLFAKTGRRAAQAFTEGANPLAAIGDLRDELNAVFSQQYRIVIDTFADRVFGNKPQKQEGLFYGLFDVYMRRHGTRMVTAVEETTRFHIRKAIQTAQEDGLGVNETAKFIRDRTSGAIGRARSATIARTETHAAASYATDAATRSLNLPNQKKRWVSVGDGRTRPSHAAANGQEVLLDEVFIIRDKGVAIAMKYPHDGNGGPSNNINCRCLAVYFTEDDELFDDLDFSDEVSPLGRGRVPTSPLVPTPDLPVQAPKPRKPKDRIQIADLVNTGKARGQLFEDRLNEWLSPLTASVAAKLPTPRTITDSKRGFMAYDGELSSHLDRSTLCHEYGHHVDMVMGTAIGIQRAWGANHWSHANFTKPFEKDRKALGIFRVSRDKRDKKLKEIYDELFTQELIDKGSYAITRSKMKFDGADSLSDILDSMVKGVFRSNYYAYGHEKSYWARGQATANVECFANLYAIHDKPKAMSIARKYFPAMVADFERALKEFNETGDIKSD